MSRNGQSADGAAAIVVRAYSLAPGSYFDTHQHETHQLVWARSGILTVSTENGPPENGPTESRPPESRPRSIRNAGPGRRPS